MKGITSLSALLVALAAAAQPTSSEQTRLTPSEISSRSSDGAGAGTSGVAGIRTTVLSGDPSKPGLYSIRLSVPPNTAIQAHTHRDDRSAVVISGVWHFGYGRFASEAATKALPPGSFYTEPAGVAHFALTKAEPVVIYLTGLGPTDTVYVGETTDARNQQEETR